MGKFALLSGLPYYMQIQHVARKFPTLLCSSGLLSAAAWREYDSPPPFVHQFFGDNLLKTTTLFQA
jgi:hypothetical protein